MKGRFELVCRDKDGNVKWVEEGPNQFSDQGEQAILDVFLRGATPPAQFYLRLLNSTPVDTTTLSTMTGEPSGSGYAPMLVERSNVGWPTLALDVGDYMASSKTVTFTSTGTITATYAILATTSNNVGLLLAYKALSMTRTLANGESLDVTYRLKVS